MIGKKILVIDDEIDLTDMVKTRLENQKYRVIVLNSSKDALKVTKKERPDLVLLDIMMPDKDGYEVCDEIKSDDAVKHTPVIVFTAKPLEKKVIKGAHGFYGADDYILKPFNGQDLLKKIESLIGVK